MNYFLNSVKQRYFGMVRFLLSGMMLLSFAQNAFARFDMDENGLGDLWEFVYQAEDLDPVLDTDGDGVSNGQESLVGSDPFDAGSYFGLNSYRFEQNHTLLVLDVQTIKGVRYYLESSADLDPAKPWRRDKSILSNGDGPLILECALDPDILETRYFRVRQAMDEDMDGLTSWEEYLLRLDDRDSVSNGRAMNDLAWLVDQYSSGRRVELANGATFAGPPRTIEEVSRFLNQATFGPTMEMIEELYASGQTYGEWINEQIAMAPTTMKSAMDSEMALGALANHQLFIRGWWRAAVGGEDQLCQRMAFALSEILVVSGFGSDLIRGSYEAAGGYYDLLIHGSFGDYTDLLEDVTYSLAMGHYLGHLRNRKANPERGTYPDENYARELMQLFSIGLWELNLDGTRKLDAQGEPIQTYTNFHITELAKVMTGFNWGGTKGFAGYLFEPELPMTLWDDEHDKGEKFLVNGGYLPPNLRAKDDVRLALENLVKHPSSGPFISRLLIQRFVTSNPSPGYVGRVARVFGDNGEGRKGDLGAVVRAIFLDPEARSGSHREQEIYGKMREPYVTYVHLVRAFDARNSPGSYPILTFEGLEDFGQIPLFSPTVFNFYLPDYSPAGEFGREDLVAPELEILTPLRSVSWPNLLKRGIELGVDPLRMSSPDSVLRHDFSDELALVGTPEALIDRLDLMFTYGTLKDETRQIVLDAMTGGGLNLSDEKKLWVAVYLIMTSPEYAILR